MENGAHDGAWVEETRKRYCLGQVALSRLAGVGRNTVYRFECGEKILPGHAESIVEALLQYGWLFERLAQARKHETHVPRVR